MRNHTFDSTECSGLAALAPTPRAVTESASTSPRLWASVVLVERQMFISSVVEDGAPGHSKKDSREIEEQKGIQDQFDARGIEAESVVQPHDEVAQTQGEHRKEITIHDPVGRESAKHRGIDRKEDVLDGPALTGV